MPLAKEYIDFHIQKFSPSLTALGSREPKLAWSINREIIFEFKNYNKLYICPLCATRAIYDEDDFVAFTNEHKLGYKFTKEHYPPKSVGGNKTVLVCDICNNSYGASIDFSIEKHLYSRALSNGSPLIAYPAILSLDGLVGFSKIKAKLLGKNKIQCLVPRKNKRVLEFVKQKINDKSQYPINFSLKIEKPPEDVLFFRAILKTAFLFCFSTWGYDFVFSATGERIREIVSGKVTHPAKSYGIYFLNKAHLKEEGVYSFKVNEKITLYLVAFKIQLKEYSSDYEFVAVIIPENSKKAWQCIAALPEEKQTIKMTTPLYKLPNYITQGDYFAFKGEGKKYNDFS